MCIYLNHECYCKSIYECNDPDWLCPTINEDEEANMCPICLDKEAKDMEDYFYRDDNGDPDING